MKCRAGGLNLALDSVCDKSMSADCICERRCDIRGEPRPRMDTNKAVASLRLNEKEHLTTNVSNSIHSSLYTMALCGSSSPHLPQSIHFPRIICTLSFDLSRPHPRSVNPS